MIDLHCHMLPGIDDGAPDLQTALKMASASVSGGVHIVACTPHILPGLYHNTGPQIRRATEEFQKALDGEGIALKVVAGADNHVVPGFTKELRSGHLLSLADTRYVLVEPPHHVVPPRLEDLFFELLTAGYVPILTHPERLTWIKSRYEAIRRLVRAGVWMQLTAGSLTGGFGRTAKYWAERMLDEGMAHILATDAHNVDRRPPNLEAGLECAAKFIGETEARHCVFARPEGVLANASPSSLPSPQAQLEIDAGSVQHGDARDRIHVQAPVETAGRGFAARLLNMFNSG